MTAVLSAICRVSYDAGIVPEAYFATTNFANHLFAIRYGFHVSSFFAKKLDNDARLFDIQWKGHMYEHDGRFDSTGD